MSDEEVVDSAPEAAADESPVVADSATPESPQGEPQAAAPQEQTFGVPELWGAFKSLPQFQGMDDRSVASGLYEALQREQAASRALQQYQQIIPFASEYLQYREPFEQWRKSQGQPQQAAPQQQAAAPQQSQWWDPPKIKDSYRQWLTKDEHGREVIDQNAPLDARAALTEHLAYKADFAKKFLENPETTLGPMVEKVAVQRAEEIVQQKIQRMRDEDFVSTLERENKDWMYDENGNVSGAGLAVQKYIQDARSLGISGAKARWEYATKMVERDMMLANLQMQYQQAQAQPTQQAQPQAAPAPAPAADTAQRNMEYLRQQAMRQASQRPVATNDARTPQKPMTFAERLTANLQSAGFV